MASLFTQEIAMDLGTANTIIIQNDKIVVDEPSIIAIDQQTGKPKAIGKKAREMDGRTHANIKTIRPLHDGVIADFNAAEQMIRGMIKMGRGRNYLISPSLKIVVCIPSGSTEVETRAVSDSAERAGGREVYLIHEPMAAALGIGIDVNAAEGNMVVDIGGGTTEIAVISLGGLVTNKSIRIAGDKFTADIQQYLRGQHNIKIGARTAEDIKINVGSALSELEDEPEPYIVRGPHQVTAMPIELSVTYQEIAHCIDRNLAQIEEGVLEVLEKTPPELYADIVKNGINLTGGGAMLRGLDKRLENKLGIPCHVSEGPLHSVARGTGIALRNVNRFQFLMR